MCFRRDFGPITQRYETAYEIVSFKWGGINHHAVTEDSNRGTTDASSTRAERRPMRELGLYDFCFMSFFLQFARKRTRSGPCSPLASACLEHSIDSGLCTTGAAFAFGAG